MRVQGEGGNSGRSRLLSDVGRNFAIDEEIAQIAARQHGNVTRAQLAVLGVADVAINHRVNRGRLHRVYRGVYAVGRPPTSPLEKASAAVLACGPRAALSHGSAMTLWGFWRRWDEPFEVTVADDRRPKGIRIHRTSTLLRRDVVVVQGIRVTSIARTLLDMATRTRPKSLTRYINDSRRNERLTLNNLADVAIRCATHPGAPVLKEFAASEHNWTRSGLEDRFLPFCQRYGLPAPLTNITLYGYEVDVYFPVERVVVELDGWPFHRYRRSFEDDREQDAAMLLHRIITIRVTDKRLDTSPDQEGWRMLEILRARRQEWGSS
jgi:Transcriptional regulator, AbiEi antitoxin